MLGVIKCSICLDSNAEWRPLHFAADGGHRDVVTVLLGAGADPAATDSAGWYFLGYLKVLHVQGFCDQSKGPFTTARKVSLLCRTVNSPM